MSGQTLSPEFRARADALIGLLNQQAQVVPTGQVSASAMYATARFNAFQVVAGSNNAEDLAAQREQAVEYFASQYRKMFADHFDECLKNFDRYTRGSERTADE